MCFAYSSLSSITLPNAITSLPVNCFLNCKYLSTITIPASVTSLGDWCFSGTGLTSIEMLPPTPPTTSEDIFVSIELFKGAPLKTIYVVDENAKALYEASMPWNRYTIVAMASGIEEAQHEKDAPRITDCYNLSGKKLDGKHSGPVIMRYADGSTQKIMMK